MDKTSYNTNRENRVTQTGNTILTIIRNSPGSTLEEINDTLMAQESCKKFNVVQLRKYMRGLHKLGYISKSFARPHRYNLIKDTPFTYTKLR